MRRSLTKKQIIRFQADIDRLFKAGKRCSLSCFKLFVVENDLPYSRMIFIPVKHYGNSVQRNLVRRQMKEIWRLNQERIKVGLDFAVVIKKTARDEDLSYEDKERLFIEILGRSGSLN